MHTPVYTQIREGGGRSAPGPRIRCGAWLREVCAARSLGKRVFRDKIKIATKDRKLHYGIYDASYGHSVMFTKL